MYTLKKSVLKKLTNKLDSVSLEFNEKTIVISEGDEKDKILELAETVKDEDPDLIFTRNGDSLIFFT